MNHVRLSDKESHLPKMRTVMHELGHWAYQNILTPADKLEFWKVAQGYIDADTGRVDESKLAKSLYNLDEEPNTELLDGPNGQVRVGNKKYDTNHHETPQEWFAAQFANWAMNERLAPEFREESYWNKSPFMREVAKYVRSVVDFFLNKKGVDPDLVPVFSKIIPDNLQAAALADGVMMPTSDAGKSVHRTMIDLTMHYDDLLEAVVSGNDDGILSTRRCLPIDCMALRLQNIREGVQSGKRQAPLCFSVRPTSCLKLCTKEYTMLLAKMCLP